MSIVSNTSFHTMQKQWDYKYIKAELRERHILFQEDHDYIADMLLLDKAGR